MTPRKRLLNVASGVSAGALAWAMASAAVALPGTPTIFDSSGGVGNAADFTPGPGTLLIDQNHERVVIDWTSFDIAPGETVTFQQDQANWIAFNRVDASTFTTIDGAINATGSVWIFSPAGMLIGANADINVGSFVASLGIFDNFQASEAMGLGDPGVFIGFHPSIANENLLSVDSGATISGTDFIVLHGANIEMAGDLTSLGGVSFINSEGAGIDFDASSPSGITLTNLNSSWEPSGRGTPSFDHTGTTTAAWIDLQYGQLFQASYQHIINLDGVMSASAATSGLLNRPANTPFVVGGVNSVTGLTGGRTVLLNVLGDLSTAAGEMNLQATDVFFALGSTIDAGTGFKVFTYGDITFQGDVESGGQTTIHSQAENATIRIESTASITTTGANMDISGNRDGATVEVFGELTGDNLVFVRSKGDVYIGSTAVITGNADDSAGNYFGIIVQAGRGFDFNTQTMTAIGSGDVYIASGAVLDATGANHANRILVSAYNGGVEMAGSIYGSRVTVAGTDDIVISGDITGSDLVQIIGENQYWVPGVGGDITVSGTIVADDLLTVYAPYGDILIESGAVLVSDADGTPTTDVFGYVQPDRLFVGAGGFINIEAGAYLYGGYAGTDVVVVRSYGADDEYNEIASIEMSGQIVASGGEIYSDYASVRLNAGASVTSTTDVFSISGEGFVVIEAGAVVYGAGTSDMGFPLVNVEEDAGIAILGSDIAIAGDVYADSIVIGVRDLDSGNVVYVGGVDDAATFGGYDLGDDFRLSEAEIGNLHTPTLMIISGADGVDVVTNTANDMIVEDLTLPSGLEILALGASVDAAIVFTGDLVPGNSQTELWVGFASVAGPEIEDRTFIPGTIAVVGSIGTEVDPFDLVTLHSAGDIGMGSEEFLEAAEEDPEFDALTPNDLAVDYGHIFIATERLQLAALGRIIQQNTAEEPGQFSGLLFAAPEVQQELIYAPDELEGFTVGGDNAWTVNFSAGPTKVQLFGEITTQSEPITGFDVAEQPNLLDPDIEENDAFTINSCRFGASVCTPVGGASNDIPQFETPTDVEVDVDVDVETDEVSEESAEDEAEVEEASDESDDGAFFRSLIAPNSDRAYEDERLGEPVTGSGNEDLWFGRRNGGQP